MEVGTQEEKRKHRRFAAREGAFAVLKDGVSKVGPIIDISRGGIAFKYMAEKDMPPDLCTLDIFLAGRKFIWRAIPHRTVVDEELAQQTAFSVVPMRRRSVAFETLNEEHLMRLEHLIGLTPGADCSSPTPP